MVRRLWNTVLDRAEALALDELSDADLVARFLANKAGPAFVAVVRRHGPLVWGVCRNLLPEETDAEDAFQATFLALARGAAGIRNPNALGAWLHAVAGRACRMSIRAKARRTRRERAAAVREAQEPVSEDAWDRWQAAVHAEVDRLPKALREAFVLCVLQGVRQPDAAQRLGWSLGTVSARVCQAKKRLIEALGRRGVVGAAGLIALTGTGPVSALLVSRATAVVAGGLVSEFVHQLARGAIGGVVGKTKLLAAGLLAVGLAIGSGVIPTAGGQGPPGTPTVPKVSNRPEVVRSSEGVPPAATPTAPRVNNRPDVSRPSDEVGAPADPPAPTRRVSPPDTDLAPTAPRSPYAGPAVKVEYKFVPTPADPNATMDLMTKLGTEGWEYAGPLPGKADRLVFKQVVRAGAAPSPTPMASPNPGSSRATSPADIAPSPRPSKPRSNPEPARDGPTGSDDVNDPTATKQIPRSEPLVLTDPVTPATGEGVGRPPVIADRRDSIQPTLEPDPALPEIRPTPVLELAPGETVRHRMKTGAVIDRIKAGASKVPLIEASPDPTDAKRVLIKAGATAGNIDLFLTDANGVQEVFKVRVGGAGAGTDLRRP